MNRSSGHQPKFQMEDANLPIKNPSKTHYEKFSCLLLTPYQGIIMWSCLGKHAKPTLEKLTMASSLGGGQSPTILYSLALSHFSISLKASHYYQDSLPLVHGTLCSVSGEVHIVLRMCHFFLLCLLIFSKVNHFEFTIFWRMSYL